MSEPGNTKGQSIDQPDHGGCFSAGWPPHRAHDNGVSCIQLNATALGCVYQIVMNRTIFQCNNVIINFTNTAMASSVPKGYHRLADLMSRYSEAAVFRRFGALNMLNLLSLQAELIDLQDQFHDMWAEDDDSSDPNEKQFSTYFRLLRGAEDSFQYEKLNEIRKKLHEYSKLMHIRLTEGKVTSLRRCGDASIRNAKTARTGAEQLGLLT